MHITVYNTLIRKKEPLETVEKGKVKMYVCGPTVYDSCHIGHARSVVVFDVIARYLKRRGYDLVYVRNFTDVDDKIIKRAKVLGEDPLALAERYIRDAHTRWTATCFSRSPPMTPTANCRAGGWMKWRPGHAWKWMNANGTPLILCSGKPPSRASRPGKARGETAVPDGISNAPP